MIFKLKPTGTFKQFQAMSALPTNISFGSNGSAARFLAHRVPWHKSCYLIRITITELQDTLLLAQIEGRDLIAKEVCTA